MSIAFLDNISTLHSLVAAGCKKYIKLHLKAERDTERDTETHFCCWSSELFTLFFVSTCTIKSSPPSNYLYISKVFTLRMCS